MGQRTDIGGTGLSRIVIVGGYGHVGRRLAAELAPTHTVVLAGRRPDQARQTAADLSVAAAALPVDATTGDGLVSTVQPGDVVVNATGDHPTVSLARATIAAGCHYTDLSADHRTIDALLTLDADARTAGGSVLPGIGLAPGATNLLAAAATHHLGGADRVDLGLLLSIADEFGPAALDWTLTTLASEITHDSDGRRHTIVPFRHETRLTFGHRGRRAAFEFGFPEQLYLPRTLGVSEAHGWFALTPAPVARAFATAARSATLRQMLARDRARRVIGDIASQLARTHQGRSVIATAVATRADQQASVTLTARSESSTTARCAATLIAAWERSRPGAGLPEQTIPALPTLDALVERGIEVSIRRGPMSPAS